MMKRIAARVARVLADSIDLPFLFFVSFFLISSQWIFEIDQVCGGFYIFFSIEAEVEAETKNSKSNLRLN